MFYLSLFSVKSSIYSHDAGCVTHQMLISFYTHCKGNVVHSLILLHFALYLNAYRYVFLTFNSVFLSAIKHIIKECVVSVSLLAIHYTYMYMYIDTLQNIKFLKILQNIKLLTTYPNTIIIYFYFRSD